MEKQTTEVEENAIKKDEGGQENSETKQESPDKEAVAENESKEED